MRPDHVGGSVLRGPDQLTDAAAPFAALDPASLAARCLAAAAACGGARRAVGGFDLALGGGSILHNIAVPTRPSAAWRDDVEAALAAFAAAGRRPAFEIMNGAVPALEAALAAAGLEAEPARPAMGMARDDAARRARLAWAGPVISVAELGAEANAAQRLAFLGFERRCFGLDDSLAARHEPGLAAEMRAGAARLYAAEDDAGALVAVASLLGRASLERPDGRKALTAELAGLCVAPRRRREGLGAALAAAVVERWFGRDGGDFLWLAAETPEATRFYERLGFVVFGAISHWR